MTITATLLWAIGTILTSVGVAIADSSKDWSNSHIDWGAKTFSIKQIQKRCQFSVWFPKSLPPGYTLIVAQIVWIGPNPTFPTLPPRQAIRLVYVKPSVNEAIDVIEIKHIPFIKGYDNVEEVPSQGYLKVPFRIGDQWHFFTKNIIDILVVSPKDNHPDALAH